MILISFGITYLLIYGPHSFSLAENDSNQKVSIFSKQHERKFDMKISMFERLPCEDRDTLRLERMNLKDINDDLIQSDTIRHVSFRNNSLKQISATILNRMRRLTCLDLSINKINLFNNNIIKHSTLRVLDLRNQNSKNIWKSKSEVENLKENENDKEITFNADGIYLPNLEHLFLDNNDIATLSESFDTSFPKLSHLYLNNIKANAINLNVFDVIPKTLSSLHLKNNNLSNLTLENMTDIIELYLDNNPLKNIEIISKKLLILSLSNGAGMGRITLYTPNLEYLDLSHNSFQLHTDFQFEDLMNLKTFLLDNNEFSRFPKFIPNLSINKLSLSYNMLTDIIPNDFEYLTSLKMLSLRSNRIKTIESNAFKSLAHLEFLDISDNQLIQLPFNWMSSLINLQYLNFSTNYFTEISNLHINSFSSVNHLFVIDNTFMDITFKELLQLPKTITVYLK